MLREKLLSIGKVLSVLLLLGVVVVIVSAYIRARKANAPAGMVTAKPVLPGKVMTIVEGYKRIETDKNGKESFRLLAAKDIGYEDGRHELEKVDLTVFGDKGRSMRILSDRGSYLRDQNLGVFDGNVKITSSEGLEVTTETVKIDQLSQTATADKAVQFRQAEVSGSSIGAVVNAKAHTLDLTKDAYVKSVHSDPNQKNSPPVEMRGQHGHYAELDGLVRFEGTASVVQGPRQAYADLITGVFNLKTKKLDRAEMRGNSRMKSLEPGKTSEATSRDMTFYFDENQKLKNSIGDGAARAVSLEKDSPREITAEKIEAYYTPTETGSVPQTILTYGRTNMKIEVAEGSGAISERLIEADGVQAFFHEDGKNLSRAEANGNAVLTVTPKQITPTAEKKRLRAPKFNVWFFDKGNSLKTFVAETGVIAEFEPMAEKTKRQKRTITGKKLTANFLEQAQDVNDLTVDGDAKFVEGDRNSTAARAVYTASNATVALRGKPRLWDASSRADADEIDANLDTGESDLRGRVRTTYYSRETTGGAAPFKNKKSPVTIASDQAKVRHNEGAARYTGNVRAWQDDDFIRAENMELDKGERKMIAWGGAQSAFYDFEREVEKNKKEIVPVFATADRITYTDADRTAHYEGSVKIKQGVDRIDSEVADAIMDQENRLVKMTAEQDVVMTQPARRAVGDKLVYTVENDVAILTGEPAEVDDREHDGLTKSPKLTLHLRDARIEANDVSDAGGVNTGVNAKAKRRVRTTHRIQN